MRRIDYLDFAKGIAIISVLLGHIIDGYCWQIVSSYHVFLFFIISGYFISTRDTLSDYAYKRGRSLLFPVVFGEALFVAVQTCMFFFSKGSAGVVSFLKAYIDNRLGLNGTPINYHQGVLWFFWALFCSSLILRVILKLKSKKLQFVSAALSFVAGVALARFLDIPFEIPASLASVLYLYLGYNLKANKDRIKRFFTRYKTVATAAITVFSLVYMFTPFMHKVDFAFCDFLYVEDIFGPLICVVFILMLSQLATRKKNLPATVINEIGKVSLYILIIHYCEMNTIDWMYLNSAFNIPVICIVLIRLAVILALGYGLSRINLLRKIFGQKTV